MVGRLAMIIDGHAHAMGKFAQVEKLIETLDRFSVDKVALCPGMKNNTTVWPLPNIPIPAIKQHPPDQPPIIVPP